MRALLPLLLALAAGEAAAQEAAGEAPERSPPAAVSYRLDPSASLLYARTFKDTSLTHDHAVHATGWSGAVTWHAQDASRCEVEITVPVSGLVVDDPSVRKAAGIAAEPPDAGDRETIRATMLGAEQLDAARFPEVRFVATRCGGTDGAIEVAGELTLHGVTRPVTASVTVSADAARFSAHGTLDLTHSAFDIQPFSFLLGAFANGDALQIGINVVGSPAEEPG